MDAQELYELYSKWTGELHFYARRELGRELNAEFLPAPEWKMIVSPAMEEMSFGTVPRLEHLGGETVELLRPEESPGREELDQLFREICLAGARVLGLEKTPLQLK